MIIKKLLIFICLSISIEVFSVQTCEDYIANEWFDSRYSVDVISGDNVITDIKTGLMWQQCSQGQSGADCSTGSATLHNWQEALVIPNELNSTTGYAGFNDWRLPNAQELRSLVARNCFNPAINETIFPETPNNWYISSTPIADYPDRAWIVFFTEGNAFIGPRNLPYHVRLVRLQ